MELNNIETLLEKYFEGKTSLAQEQTLRDYFTGDQITSHLEGYIPLFKGFEQAKGEASIATLKFPETKKPTYKKWMGIAAAAIIVLSVTGFIYEQNTTLNEEKEALMAYQQTKKALLMVSKNLNKGTEDLVHLNQFTQTKNKYFK